MQDHYQFLFYKKFGCKAKIFFKWTDSQISYKNIDVVDFAKLPTI